VIEFRNVAEVGAECRFGYLSAGRIQGKDKGGNDK
jgi:hypothetical protein